MARKLKWPILAAGCALCWPAVVFAQQAVVLPNEDSGYLQWVIAGGIAVLVGLPAFLNPKRSHQA